MFVITGWKSPTQRKCGQGRLQRVFQILCSLEHAYHSNPTTPKLQHTSNQEQYDQCGNSPDLSQGSDDGILLSDTC